MTLSSSNLCYNMGNCVRYQASPKDSHLLAVKTIIKYVSRIVDYGLWYNRDTTASLVGYCDANRFGNSKDWKSTFGGCFFLTNNLVSWFS